MTELILFASMFLLVFALGIQSLNVNNGQYLAAFITSIFIGIGNIVVLKLAPDASPTEIVAFLSGGPFGIVLSMYVHRKVSKKKK